MSNNKITAFLSYAREDDDKNNKSVSKLCKALEREVKARTGKSFEIFQDVRHIGIGEDWWLKIQQDLDSVNFLIVVVTPKFFESVVCREELKYFLDRENKIGHNDLIVPIYFEDCQSMQDHEDMLETIISSRHRIDWRDIKSFDINSRIALIEIEQIAKQIKEALEQQEKEALAQQEKEALTHNNRKSLNKTRRILFYGLLGFAGGLGAVGLSKLLEYLFPPSTPISWNSNKPIIWKMATSWSNPAFTESLTYKLGPKLIKELVEKMSGDRLKIEIIDKPSNQSKDPQVKPDKVLQAVKDGVVECGHTASYYYYEDYPSLIFGTTVPFGFNAQQQIAWLNYRIDDKYEDEDILNANNSEPLTFMQKHYRNLKLNIIQFPAGSTGGQMGGWFRERIPEGLENYEDLPTQNGKEKFKMRIAGLASEMLSSNKLYITSDLIGKEITNALKNGDIDAAEWIGPYEDMVIDLHKAGAKYYYYPGWWEPGTTYEMQINLDAWNILPKDLQKIFKAACHEAHLRMLAAYDNLNRKKLWELCDHLNSIQVLQFNRNLLLNAKKKRHQAIKNMMSKINNDDEKRFSENLYLEWLRFESRIKNWHKIIYPDNFLDNSHNNDEDNCKDKYKEINNNDKDEKQAINNWCSTFKQ